MDPERITSAQNPKVKRLLSLQEKSSLRRESGLFVVEGRRELEHCITAGFVPEALFVCPELMGDDIVSLPGVRPAATHEGRNTRGSITGGPSRRDGGVSPEGELPKGRQQDGRRNGGPDVFYLSREVYSRVAYRGSTEGVIAEVRAKEVKPEDLLLRKNPLIVVLEGVEKPGNIGAVLRSADACGADAVIVCAPLTDLYNPNIIRASIGAVFTVPVVCCSSEEAAAWLKSRGIRILTAQLQDSSYYYDVPMTGGTAIVMGTESTGLSDTWRKAADAHIMIPMLGSLDSLNVSVSAAILLFEAVRQRLSKH